MNKQELNVKKVTQRLDKFSDNQRYPDKNGQYARIYNDVIQSHDPVVTPFDKIYKILDDELPSFFECKIFSNKENVMTMSILPIPDQPMEKIKKINGKLNDITKNYTNLRVILHHSELDLESSNEKLYNVYKKIPKEGFKYYKELQGEL